MKPTKKTSSNNQGRLHPNFHLPPVYFAALLGGIALLLLGGCATVPRGQEVGPTKILQAQEEIPEEQLLDVGILVFATEEVTPERAEEEGTTGKIRQAETHFMPYHLKSTLQQSSHWGGVHVVPDESASVDVAVKGEILHSNGEDLVLAVEVVDATGKTWFQKRYRDETTTYGYDDLERGAKDVFQDLYNTVANDLINFQKALTPEEIKAIRTVSQIKFAADFAPDAFQGYLAVDEEGRATITRLPSDDDPMMARLLKIREREFMYVDTLNSYYDTFYNVMWPSYENWRKMNLTEREAIRKIKKEAAMRQLMGVLLLAGAVALGTSDSNTGGLEIGMVIIGGQVIVDGFNVSKSAEMHSAAIKELSESFASEMKPVVMEFEGQQYELTGSAQEQFTQWRELLRRIYFAETGFDPNLTDDSDTAVEP